MPPPEAKKACPVVVVMSMFLVKAIVAPVLFVRLTALYGAGCRASWVR